MEIDQNLSLEEIDDILDEIEERETLLSHNLDLENIKSLIISIRINGSSKIPNFDIDTDFDQKSFINGFIFNFMSYYQSLPIDLINDIIDLCILFTFSLENHSDKMIIIDDEETSISRLSEEEDDYDDNDDNTDHNHNLFLTNICQDKGQFGHAQSPINLVTSPHSPFVFKPLNDEQFIRNPLKFNYPLFIEGCTIINNGHTVQINLPSNHKNDENQCTLFINNKYFILKQFHFHTPSEHTIDGKQHDMEMHLVHINEKENKIAVLGFLYSTNSEIGRYIKKPLLQLTKSRNHLYLKSPQEQESMILKTDQMSSMKIMQESEGDETDDADDEQNPDSEIETDDEWDEQEQDKQKEKEPDVCNDFLDQFWNELPMKKTNEIYYRNQLVLTIYLKLLQIILKRTLKQMKCN